MRSNLKSLRERAGLSLQELGDMCGIPKQSLWNLELPKANPTLTTAYKLAAVLFANWRRCVSASIEWLLKM